MILDRGDFDLPANVQIVESPLISKTLNEAAVFDYLTAYSLDGLIVCEREVTVVHSRNSMAFTYKVH